MKLLALMIHPSQFFFFLGVISLSPEQREELVNLIKNNVATWQIRKRLEAIRLLDKGYKVESVALQLSIKKHVVYNYIKRFKDEGFSGLILLEKPGKESQMTEEHFIALEKFVEEKVKELGSCRLKDMTEFLRDSYGITLSEEWLSIRLSYRKRDKNT